VGGYLTSSKKKKKYETWDMKKIATIYILMKGKYYSTRHIALGKRQFVDACLAFKNLKTKFVHVLLWQSVCCISSTHNTKKISSFAIPLINYFFKCVGFTTKFVGY
jgi:hypothetical protein